MSHCVLPSLSVGLHQSWESLWKIWQYYVIFWSCCSCWVLRHASDIEREKSDKFCSEALISTWGSFTCCKSTTRDPRLYFPSEGSHSQDFYALKKSIDRGRDRTREPRIQRLEWQPLDHRGGLFWSERQVGYNDSDRLPLWSRGNIVTSHAADPGLIPGRISFLVEVFSRIFP